MNKQISSCLCFWKTATTKRVSSEYLRLFEYLIIVLIRIKQFIYNWSFVKYLMNSIICKIPHEFDNSLLSVILYASQFVLNISSTKLFSSISWTAAFFYIICLTENFYQLRFFLLIVLVFCKPVSAKFSKMKDIT